MNTNIRPFILRALRRASGIPTSEETMIQTVQIAFAPPPSMDEVKAIIGDLESEGFVSAFTDELTQIRNLTLTPKGQARAIQLR